LATAADSPLPVVQLLNQRGCVPHWRQWTALAVPVQGDPRSFPLPTSRQIYLDLSYLDPQEKVLNYCYKSHKQLKTVSTDQLDALKHGTNISQKHLNGSAALFEEKI